MGAVPPKPPVPPFDASSVKIQRASGTAAQNMDQDFLRLRLLSAINNNNYDDTADVCTDIFHRPGYFDLGWEYLRAAACKGNKDIVRLLMGWGAKVDEAEMMKLPLHDPVGVLALNTLKACGVGLRDWPKNKQPFGTKPEDHPVVTHSVSFKTVDERTNKVVDTQITKLPAEWLKVLKTLHEMGATEAVIAGGALRDTFNQRAVRDVDIFLANPVSGFFQKSKQKKFLAELFQKAGLEIHEQIVGTGDYGGNITAAFPQPVHNEIVTVDYGAAFMSPTTSWRIVAGPNKTEYNIVFVNKTLAESMKRGEYGKLDLLKAFDIGLCQIATDGQKILMTEYYKNDENKKQVEVWHEDQGTSEHLERILQKYKDYKVGEIAQKILNRPRPPVVESWGS